MVNKVREQKHHSASQKSSRHKREERIAAGNEDPDYDFVCSDCDGVYSHYHGRHKLHIEKCKHRIAWAMQIPDGPPLPPPPPFEKEVFTVPAEPGKCFFSPGRFPLTHPTTS